MRWRIPVGALITIAIAQIVWQSAKAIFTRMFDGVDPDIIEEIRHAATHVRGVAKVTDVRARWLGHRLYAEMNVAVAPQISVDEGHVIAKEVRHEAMHHIGYLSNVVIHIDPMQEAGEKFHHLSAHSHDGLPVHSH